MGWVVLLVSVLTLPACASLHRPAETLAQRNRDALASLQPGMTRAQVAEALDGVARSVREIPDRYALDLESPYRTLHIREPDGAEVEILYYYTAQLRSDGYVGEDELTPVLMRDGLVVGWGAALVEREVDPDALNKAVAESILAEMQRDQQVAQAVVDEELEQAYREALGRARMLI